MDSDSSQPLLVGAVLFPGFELLDVFGPLEMFGVVEDRFRIITLGEKIGPVASFQGPAALVEQGLADAPAVDVLLLPGGNGTRALVKSPLFLGHYTAAAERARVVATVCTGSGVLARTGLLDGRRATSNKLSFHFARAMGRNVQWLGRARWVRDGKFYTSSGVSAGMDMALAIIQDLLGREAALEAAKQAEYTWNEDPADDPFAVEF